MTEKQIKVAEEIKRKSLDVLNKDIDSMAKNEKAFKTRMEVVKELQNSIESCNDPITIIENRNVYDPVYMSRYIEEEVMKRENAENRSLNDNYIPIKGNERKGRKVFKEGDTMYICELQCLTTLGYNEAVIWKETKSVPRSIRDTKRGGAGVIEQVEGQLYLLSNTGDETLGKWFVPYSSGIYFEELPEIPEGFLDGYNFIIDKYNLNPCVRIRKYAKYTHIIVEMGMLKSEDYKIKQDLKDELKALKCYKEMKEFFFRECNNYVAFDLEIDDGTWFDKENFVEWAKENNPHGSWKYKCSNY